MSLSEGNIINVRLRKPESLDLKKLTRHVFTSSSCGICSKASIEAVRQQFAQIEDDFEVEPKVLLGLPASLASAQETFKRTGGLHACALFDSAGNLLVLREDVGRHNALDKVVGWALLGDRLPLRQHILMLSGRTSFEMMQKALAAGIPIVAAISAPSSLAVEFAHDSSQTLVGFLRGERMNIYAGAGRVQGSRRHEREPQPRTKPR
jgi:FdhD protein